MILILIFFKSFVLFLLISIFYNSTSCQTRRYSQRHDWFDDEIVVEAEQEEDEYSLSDAEEGVEEGELGETSGVC